MYKIGDSPLFNQKNPYKSQFERLHFKNCQNQLSQENN